MAHELRRTSYATMLFERARVCTLVPLMRRPLAAAATFAATTTTATKTKTTTTTATTITLTEAKAASLSKAQVQNVLARSRR